MSRSTISTFQLCEMSPDEETARLYLEGRLWRKGPVCPTCAAGYTIRKLTATHKQDADKLLAELTA